MRKPRSLSFTVQIDWTEGEEEPDIVVCNIDPHPKCRRMIATLLRRAADTMEHPDSAVELLS